MSEKLAEAQTIIAKFVNYMIRIEEAQSGLTQLSKEAAEIDLAEETAEERDARELQEFEDKVCELLMNRKGDLGKNTCDDLIGSIKRIRRPRKEEDD